METSVLSDLELKLLDSVGELRAALIGAMQMAKLEARNGSKAWAGAAKTMQEVLEKNKP